MQYLYTQNPSANKPIILVDKYIGRKPNGEMGIDGAQMSREIIALKNSGVTEAEMWINSKGGQWSEGVSIVGTMRNSGIDFTTINMGYVDSTAGHIFAQGKPRVWNSYGIGLVHEIQGDASDNIREAMNASIATLLSEKSNRSPDQVRELMQSNTMITPKLAKDYGFADEFPACQDILQFTNSSDPIEVSEFGQSQIQKLLPKKRNMEALNTVLGLTNDANEASQLIAINKIIEARNAAQTELDAKVIELTNANTAFADTKGKLLVAENEILTATNAAKQTAAEALVKEHVGKRIVDTAENITKWTNAAKADYEGTKALIEAINLNVTAPATPKAGARQEGAPATSVFEYMKSHVKK